MSKGMSVNEPESDPTEEEPPIANLPMEVVVGNRQHKRRKGARSTYADRLRELQRKKEETDGD